MATGSTARRGDLADSVCEELRRWIVSGAMAPGTRVVERDIAQRLSVSRTPVRAAIRRLSDEGFIVLNHADCYSRPVVAPLDADDARDLHAVVASLDASCAYEAAGLSEKARTALTRDLEKHNAAFARAVADADLTRALEHDDRFHSTYAGAVNKKIVATIRRRTKPLERYARCYLPHLVKQGDAAVDEHRAIIAAIAAGNPTEAYEAALRNWRNAAARLMDAIERAGERGTWTR